MLEELVRRAGLEISVVKLSDLESSQRIDSEYYRPEYLTQDRKLENYDPQPLSNVAKVFDGNHMTIKDEFSDEGIRYLRGQDLGDFFISDSNPVYIPRELYDGMPRCHMKPGDVLLSVIGTVGSVSFVTDKYDFLTGSCKIVILRADKVNPYFLAAYLMSDIGQGQIQRRVRGAVQQGLILPDVKVIPVPTVSPERAGKVESLIKQSLQKKTDSVSLYAEAQRLLAAELGLDRLDLSESLFNVRRVSDVQLAGRVDAEYFKPKYGRLLEYLQQTGQAIRLSDGVREPLKRGVQPEYIDDGDVLVINSQHVGKTHVELENNRRTTKYFCSGGSNKRALVQKNDVLMNSTGYITIGRAQTLLENVQAMVDGHVTIIRPKDGLDPVYLGLYLNSQPGQLQTERGWTGSSGQIELRIEVISNFLIWKAPMPIQLRIRELVEAAYLSRQEAASLLIEAKGEVEKLIEGG